MKHCTPQQRARVRRRRQRVYDRKPGVIAKRARKRAQVEAIIHEYALKWVVDDIYRPNVLLERLKKGS